MTSELMQSTENAKKYLRSITPQENLDKCGGNEFLAILTTAEGMFDKGAKISVNSPLRGEDPSAVPRNLDASGHAERLKAHILELCPSTIVEDLGEEDAVIFSLKALLNKETREAMDAQQSSLPGPPAMSGVVTPPPLPSMSKTTPPSIGTQKSLAPNEMAEAVALINRVASNINNANTTDVEQALSLYRKYKNKLDDQTRSNGASIEQRARAVYKVKPDLKTRSEKLRNFKDKMKNVASITIDMIDEIEPMLEHVDGESSEDSAIASAIAKVLPMLLSRLRG